MPVLDSIGKVVRFAAYFTACNLPVYCPSHGSSGGNVDSPAGLESKSRPLLAPFKPPRADSGELLATLDAVRAPIEEVKKRLALFNSLLNEHADASSVNPNWSKVVGGEASDPRNHEGSKRLYLSGADAKVVSLLVEDFLREKTEAQLRSELELVQRTAQEGAFSSLKFIPPKDKNDKITVEFFDTARRKINDSSQSINNNTKPIRWDDRHK